VKKSYRITLADSSGKTRVVKVVATGNAAAIAAAQKFMGVSAEHTSLRCEGPIDVDISAAGVKRIYHYGFDNRGSVRVLANSSAGTEAAATKYIGIPDDTDYDSLQVDPEAIDVEA
jgi:hypothetical protein